MNADDRQDTPGEANPCQELRSWQAALSEQVGALREELRAVHALVARALAERAEAAPGPSGRADDGRRPLCGFDPHWAAPGEEPG
ncbi:hypothetical protein [Streptomyces sp. NPDC049590]|uniref:hypothetical protein n=1 Tax=Streptomyces sp. NPDC049590 TaxID=3154834 RepID=UPI00341B2D6D